jgi:WD40 repeat protein
VNHYQLSPDRRTLLTLGADYTARLWETSTGKRIAVLRQGSERVVNGGFSADGRTVFTDDQTSVARFWDVPGGTFRAATEPRPNRYTVPEHWLQFDQTRTVGSRIGADRLLTRRSTTKGASGQERTWEGPVELWDTVSGRRVAQLDTPDRDIALFQFVGGGRWITTLEGGSTVLVFAAADGRLLARLPHEAGSTVWDLCASPRGRRFATIVTKDRKRFSMRTWETGTWREEPAGSLRDLDDQRTELEFFTDDLFALRYDPSGGDPLGPAAFHRHGQAKPLCEFTDSHGRFLAANDDVIYRGDGCLFNARNGQRLLPPPGRKFHPALATFAPDGRFLPAFLDGGNALIDTKADKSFRTTSGWGLSPSGMVTVLEVQGEVRFLPPADRLRIPADLLERWAQVAVGGEIGPDGQFLEWDEPTWERKRQELAAQPVPWPDFPFPGYVATVRRE